MAGRIVTLTVNPALDVGMVVTEMRPEHKLRATDETYDAGGGGINVARVVHALGGDTLAVIAVGGETGRFVRQMLSGSNVPYRAMAAGQTRVSVTIHEKTTGREYRFVPAGPSLVDSDAERILKVLARTRGDWLVASGSLAPGLPADFYARIAHFGHRRDMRVALDTSGEPLRAALYQGIDLLKTSRGEFESIASGSIADREALGEEASRLVRGGAASMIVVTLGREGAMLATPDHRYFQPSLAVQTISSVGAGDSFLAGLVLGLARRRSPEAALRFATAVAAAAVIEKGTARVDPRQVAAFARRLPKPAPATI